MKNRKTQALIQILLILGIVIVLNVISVRLFARVDLTQQGVYTLSDASKTLVANLDDKVTIKAYFTEDLPAPYNTNRRATLDILNEYKAYAGGYLQFEFLNPEGEKGEQEAREQGIPAVEVQVVEEDKFQVKRAFLGLVFLYEDKKEVMPVVQNLGSLEYDISSTIKRLTARVKKKIGFTTGHQEPAIASLSTANRSITQQYETVTIDLSKNEPIPADLAALFILAPQSRFSDSATYQVDDYLMRGGRIGFLLNRVNASLQMRFGQPVDLGLDELLEHYGVRVNPDLVRDAQCANISVMQQIGPFPVQSQIPFPYIPNASNMDRENPMVKDLQGVLFHFVSSIDTSAPTAKGLTAQVLIRSSKRSGRQTGFFAIDPFHRYTAQELSESEIPLVAVVHGKFKSFFSEREPKASITQSPETRIILVGDGDFMKDDFLGNRDNLTFFVNMVDYLADDAGLITIRSKNIALPQLEPVSDGTKQLLKYANLLAPPLLAIAYGMFRWRRRLALKRSLELQN
jgi:gliding-associated putative ABC transporter substrate-binding component GldG